LVSEKEPIFQTNRIEKTISKRIADIVLTKVLTSNKFSDFICVPQIYNNEYIWKNTEALNRIPEYILTAGVLNKKA
jgi:hypothetical protein